MLSYDQKRREDLRRFVRALRRKCSRCPEDNPARLQFHHRDPRAQNTTIADLVGTGNKERLLAELAKEACRDFLTNPYISGQRRHHMSTIMSRSPRERQKARRLPRIAQDRRSLDG